MYIRVAGKMPKQHFHISLFSNPRDNVMKICITTGKNMSLSFNKNHDLVPRIKEPQNIEMLVWHFSNIPVICEFVGKLPEQYLNGSLLSNPGDKILTLVEI